MSDVRLSIDEAQRLIVGALTRSRTSEENAGAVARALVAAELAGQAGHGLRRVEAYSAQALAGKVDGFATPEITRVRPAAFRVDAATGFAFPAFEAIANPLADAAREQGLAMAGIFRSHHCGAAGTLVEGYAEDGMIALLFANTPAALASWGGARPVLGTNPIAFAAPIAGAAPLVVDAALSAVARGKVMAANQKGEAIPEGWAFDAEGKPTTDAGEALKGTLAPLGGAKGVALAMMVELLAGGLTGANFSYQTTSFFDDKGAPPGVGQLLMLIDADAIEPGAAERFAAFAETFTSDSDARLPGRRRQALRETLTADGIPAPQSLIDAIEAVGR